MGEGEEDKIFIPDLPVMTPQEEMDKIFNTVDKLEDQVTALTQDVTAIRSHVEEISGSLVLDGGHTVGAVLDTLLAHFNINTETLVDPSHHGS
jgi:hypothetical protein